MTDTARVKTTSYVARLSEIRLRSFPSAFISIAAFLALWEAISRTGVVPASLFPAPTRVATALLEWATTASRPVPSWLRPALLRNDMFWDTFVSVRRALFGWLAGGLAGIVV